MKTTKKLKRMVAGVLASLMAMSGTANICAADTEENVHLSMAFWAEQSEIDRLDQLLEIWKADHPNDKREAADNPLPHYSIRHLI